ncbi:MAG: helix-turn-helix transcriptional regulator [Chloroflexota bacterium]|jgi:transcriptional regulator with XRE-family HTH domain
MKWEDLRGELFAIPGFKEEFDADFPYHDLSLEIGGLRADMDLTQTEFGRLVGMPQSTVARLESGQQNPSVGTLKRIAEATGTELVIEFRRPRRERRARRRRPAASSGRESRTGRPLAASPADD